MTPLEPKGPNAEQIKVWNESGIAYYFAHKDAINAERAPLTRRPIERSAAGMRAGIWLRFRRPDDGAGAKDWCEPSVL